MNEPERPWPWSPRPFVDETFDSWFGRVAARYRLSVDQLAQAIGIELDLGSNCERWLIMQPSQGNSLLRIAALARMNPSTLTDLAGEANALMKGPALRFCFKCLVLNPIEIKPPYWRSAWIFEGFDDCPIHRQPLEQLPLAVLGKARNMTKFVSYICRHRTRRRMSNVFASALRDHGSQNL